jgi:hypothetical protein
MSTPKSSDEVMRKLNDLAKAQGRYLDKCFWEIPRQPGSILDVPLTPEAEERIRRLDATIERLRAKQKMESSVNDRKIDKTYAAPPVELAPADYRDPVIELFKKDVDRTLLRENLKLSVDERVRKAESFHESIELCRGAARRPQERN